VRFTPSDLTYNYTPQEIKPLVRERDFEDMVILLVSRDEWILLCPHFNRLTFEYEYRELCERIRLLDNRSRLHAP